VTDTLYGVYGAGGCGRGVMPLVRRQVAAHGATSERLVFVDDGRAGDLINGHRVLTYADFLKQSAPHKSVVLALADGRRRAQLAERCETDGVGFFEARADNVVELDDVSIGEGAILCPFVTVTSNIRIGRHFHANLYSYVEHDCVIGDFVTFAPGVKCNGNIVIEDFTYVGSGAVIRQGVAGAPLVIGAGAVIGMGAVVTKSISPGVTVVGNPARPLDSK
jgi:sugar O-acyltransferase (sialic acid O-acetyltransferase NeuD family)